MKEKPIEKSILQYLNAQPDTFAFKVNTVGVFDPVKKVYRKPKSKYLINGVSDILCQTSLGLIFFEVKSPTGKQTDSQKAFEHNIKRCNGFYYVVRSIEDAKKALEEIQVRVKATTTTVS